MSIHLSVNLIWHFLFAQFPNAIAATRVEDKATVWLKISPVSSSELEIQARFMAAALRDDPKNACCPLLDFLAPPLINGQQVWLLVMPALRPIDRPEPKTVQDVLAMVSDLSRGLAFLHQHNVAHR